MDFLGKCVQKPTFSSFSLLTPLFSETFGHQSQSFVHQTKPETSYYHHLKYEPDLSTHARDKWGVKIVTDCGTPCITNVRVGLHGSILSGTLLSGVIRNGSPQNKAQDNRTFLGHNQLNRLQMVLFECPRYRNPCNSSNFG